ncbi:helix-turn-helix domain-containing protein [Chitinophagaceae bacterium MMS25-I14]
MINVLEPHNILLKQFVDSIYVFRKSTGGFEFTAYPTTNTAIGLLRNAAVTVKDGSIHIENATASNHFAMACNQFSGSLHLQYAQLADEIAINFKPLGFASFTRSKPENEKVFRFRDWDEILPDLFRDVFATEDQEQQLHRIEKMLLDQYRPLPCESILLKTLALLNDTANDYKIQEIADLVGTSYKQLYRHFTENIGCSPAHYRTLVKFRTSVISKLKKGNKARLTDICYDNDYTDQPYFTKQFKSLSGEKPGRFFKEVSSFGNDKVIFKID